MLNKSIFTILTILVSYFLMTGISFATDTTTQLKLERAGRLIASSFITGNPDKKLFGLHSEYSPARPREMIHSNIDITIKIDHSIQETKETPVKIKGMKEFEKWLRDVRNNFRIPENISVRTMGTCIKGCCNYPLDGGISHNTLYLTQACFFIENKTPYLKSITLLDGD